MLKSTFFTDKKVLGYAFGTLITGAVMSQIGPETSLDARFYYSFEEGKDFLAQLNSNQKEAYLLNEFLDLGLIFFYSSFLYVGLSRLFHKSFLGIKYLGLLPGVFDFIETKSIILLLNNTIDTSILYWLGSITAAKWIFGAINAIAFLLGFYFRFRRSP
ncbi:MAG: hypothetical protein HRT44_00780 [Bdellovibrionales bacterium]|nr:hypothetical protein [Bdellovibrionales bacterium]NQZ17784.1 hypothetical protein [Bdellovibrionales bacterium]